MSILPFSVESFGLSKPVVDEVKVPLRRCDAALRFLEKSVQHVNRFGIADRINPTPSVAAVVRDDFKHRSSAKAFQGLGRRVGFAMLGGVEGLADVATDLAREPAQVSPARTDPNDLAPRSCHYTYIRLSV